MSGAGSGAPGRRARPEWDVYFMDIAATSRP